MIFLHNLRTLQILNEWFFYFWDFADKFSHTHATLSETNEVGCARPSNLPAFEGEGSSRLTAHRARSRLADCRPKLGVRVMSGLVRGGGREGGTD